MIKEISGVGEPGKTREKLNFSLFDGLRVLIVDDEVDTREFVRFLLQENGAQITAVASANEALEAIAQTVPDLLISDLGIPEIDGYSLLTSSPANLAV